jgi:hypothetical protein
MGRCGRRLVRASSGVDRTEEPTRRRCESATLVGLNPKERSFLVTLSLRVCQLVTGLRYQGEPPEVQESSR